MFGLNRKTIPKKSVLTGDRPTGRLHLGHYVGSLENRVKLQGEYPQYVMVADVQALTDNFDNPEKVRANVLEVAMDNLAVGVDPKKSKMFIQSLVPEIAELTIYFLNLVTVSRLKQNPTVKNEIKEKGFGEQVPAGFLMYPISQAADMLFLKTNLIPVGEDQLPVIEQANEIVEKFNRIYGETFPKLEPMVGTGRRLSGIDGKAKMSKSLGNAIYLSDPTEEVTKKVMQMYTDPKHIHASDPGHVEGNVVFEYLDIFDPASGEVAELKKQYKKGGLGDVVIKKRLIGVLEDFLSPIRARRSALEKDQKKVMDILMEGTKEVRKKAIETMGEVRERMKIDYQ
jgi:tryptophanyl-tRNA synthetase